MQRSHQEVDGLDSARYYKKRFLAYFPGRAICAALAFMKYYELMDSSVMHKWFDSYIGNPIVPTAKPSGIPTSNSIHNFMRHDMSSHLGFIQSAPTTLPQSFGLSFDCLQWGLDDACKFIEPKIGMNIKKRVIEEAQKILLNGMAGPITFHEDSGITSKLESELFPGFIKRVADFPSESTEEMRLDGTSTEDNILRDLSAEDRRRYLSSKQINNKEG
jgi:hypothetical protein